jgi:hypothetical protein
LYAAATKKTNISNNSNKKPKLFALFKNVAKKFVLRHLFYKSSNVADFMYIDTALENFLRENYKITKR